MPRKASPDLYISFLMIVSFYALLVVAIFTFSTSTLYVDFHWRHPAIGLIYISACVLGILAVFFPSRCSRIFHHDVWKENANLKEYLPSDTSIIFGLQIVHGHHPKCKYFFDHELEIGKKTFCVGCLGLFFGAFFSIFGAINYFFGSMQIETGSISVIISGILGVAFSLIQLPFIKVHGFIRLLLNSFLIIGTFLILIGIDTLVHSIAFELFLIILSFFWVWTRIALSKWDHARICYACGFKCSIKHTQ